MSVPASGGARYWTAALCLLPCTAGVAAAWALLSLATQRQCGWMALVVALDALLILRLMRTPGGTPRALLAFAATALGIVLGNWWIAGAQIGASLGMMPWDAIPRLGLAYAWTLTRLSNGMFDVACMACALLGALVFGSATPKR